MSNPAVATTKRTTSAPFGEVEIKTIDGLGGTLEYLEFPDVGPKAPMKPNKQFYVEQLANGRNVGIHQVKEYPTFFKLFSRYCENNHIKKRVSLRQLKEDLWLLMPRDNKSVKPNIVLEGDFREHGRYKYYAARLDLGDQLSFSDKKEANKARRAWMLYNPTNGRNGRTCVMTTLPKAKKFVVSVQDSAG